MSSHTDGDGRRVLILGPDGSNRRVLDRVCTEAGLISETRHGDSRGVNAIETNLGQVVLLGESTLASASHALLDRFKQQPPWSALPVVTLLEPRAEWRFEGLLTELRRYCLLSIATQPVRLSTFTSLLENGRRIRAQQFEVRDLLEKLGHVNEILDEQVRRRTATIEVQSTRLRQLAAALTEAEQNERERISRLLHDDVQQTIVGAQIFLGNAIAQGTDEVTMQSLKHVRDVLDDGLKTTRSLAAELSPSLIANEGLLKGFEWLGQRMEELHGLLVACELETDREPASLPVCGLLFQCVRELLFNVVKHARVESARLRVESADGLFLITVADEGRGFSPNGSPTKKQDGDLPTGLGLPRMQRRLEFFGGGLEIDSQPGEGTVASVSMPLEATPVSPGVLELNDGPPEPTAHDVGAKRVLIVDDHDIVRTGLGILLDSFEEIEVVGETGDFDEALQLAQQNCPQVALVDIRLQGSRTGIGLTQEIQERCPDIAVVGLTAYASASVRREMITAGATAVLDKRCSPPELVEAIRAASG